MVLPGIKDNDLGMASSSMAANKYAAANPAFAPYQYSRKDGGLWVKAYGTFEKLQMNNGLSGVKNNAYGTIMGADFGLKELKHGWKFMPTAYIGYNGAHQTYSGVSAYQNGGQIGLMGTAYKDNFIVSLLGYGGIYDNNISIKNGHVDRPFNYYAGAATKAAYNIKLHRDFAIQPNLMFAYNFFGRQHYNTDFGQMAMMSSTLNGMNLAPGLNFIWEKETFSLYATVQDMFNLHGPVGGQAGNVNLERLSMERGYLQYGIGATKKFNDRASGYVQTVIRNVGRTGIGFQAGFQWKLGKDVKSTQPTEKKYVQPKSNDAKTSLIKKNNQISLLRDSGNQYDYVMLATKKTV
jgi:hypothetical protein